MEENLELALQRIFGGELTKDRDTPLPGTETAQQKISAGEETDRQIGIKALDHYRKAQDFLKQGNWSAYGEELGKMAELLKKIENRR